MKRRQQALGKFFTKRRSVLFTWLISYIIVLLIPVLISGLTYIQTSKVIEKEINNSNNLSLKKVRHQMDNLISDAERLSTEISMNPRIGALLKLSIKYDELSGYDIYEAIKDMSSYKIANNSMDNFFIYFKNLDMILSTYTCKDIESYYDTYIKETGISFDDWKNTFSKEYPSNYITTYKSNVRGKQTRNITLIKTIPLNVQGIHSANIVITLDQSRFMEDANDIAQISEGSVLILDSNNNIVATSKEEVDIENIKYDNLTNSNGMVHMEIEGKKVVVSYISSQIANWKYISIVPYSVFWEKANYTKNLTLISIVLCLFLGGVITIVALKKNYNPISKLVKLLENNDINFDSRNNEYVFIQQVIDKLQSDKKMSDKILEQQNKELRAGLFARLLKGKFGGKLPIIDALNLHGINFVSDNFTVMVFYIEDLNDVILNAGEGSQDETYDKFKMVQFIVTNVVEEMVGQKSNLGYVTELDDMLVCLINFRNDDINEAKEETHRIARESQEFLSKHFNINFLVGASGLHKTLAGVPEAYTEALQTLEYKQVLGDLELIHYEDIIGMPKGDYYYPLEIEQQLINSIKVGDFGSSKELVCDIFSKNFENTKLPLEIARCLVFDLVSTMIKTVNDTNTSLNNDFITNLKPVEKLLSCKSISEMKKEMLILLESICNLVAKSKVKTKNKDLDKQLALNVKEYVTENYSDEGLGVTSIAENFGIHLVQLSKVFKEQTGEGLADYITKVRLKKAKELLKDYSNIEQVSKAVGYSNIRTFMRAFKKIEGITPGKYKEIE